MKSRSRAPIAKGSKPRSHQFDLPHVSAVDHLQTIVVPANAQEGDVLLSIPIAPQRFSGTRLEAMARIYERYRFKRFTAHYKPSVPTTTGGQVVMYIDTDPTDSPSALFTGVSRVRQALSHRGAVRVNIWDEARSVLPPRGDDQMFFTGRNGNVRLSQQGVLHVVLVAPPVNSSLEPLGEVSIGTIAIDWECCFDGTQIEGPTFSIGGGGDVGPGPIVPEGYSIETEEDEFIVDGEGVRSTRSIAIPQGTIAVKADRFTFSSDPTDGNLVVDELIVIIPQTSTDVELGQVQINISTGEQQSGLTATTLGDWIPVSITENFEIMRVAGQANSSYVEEYVMTGTMRYQFLVPN